MKFDIAKTLLITIIGVSIGYVGISTWDKYSEAQLYNLTQYFSGIEGDELDKQLPACPKLVRVEGVSGAIILKDECTNLYWHNIDLPLEDISGNREGYTWYEAEAFCENLATSDGRSLFRLPTADELFSLATTPCTGGSCSPITDITAKTYVYNNATEEFEASGPDVTASREYFYENPAGSPLFAEGAYWSSSEIDINDSNRQKPDATSESFEAATSVNLKYGTVNNPVFGKYIRLNTRCIFEKLSDQDIYALNTESVKDLREKFIVDDSIKVSEIIWWENKGVDASNNQSMLLTLAQRKNWIPNNEDVNNCPEGVSTELTGDVQSAALDDSFVQLCTGVSTTTSQHVTFGCSSGSYVKNLDFETALATFWADGTVIPNTLSPAICQ